MPTGTRIRANNVYGVTSDNPLAAAATTFNSVSLPLLPVVAIAHAIIVFDPKRVYGDPEIVVVTAHTASSTVATILRGQYGTSQRQHPQGTSWAHVPINEDWIQIVTSTTHPSNPYEGQFIFEMDTNKLYGYGGVDWAPRDAGGQIGYAQVVAGQAAITAAVDLTGLSVVVTVGTGRRIRIMGYVEYSSTAAATVITRILESATQLNEFQAYQNSPGNGVHTFVSVVLTPSAGSHTYKLTGQVSGGTGAMLAGAINPSYILVEDIGAA